MTNKKDSNIDDPNKSKSNIKEIKPKKIKVSKEIEQQKDNEKIAEKPKKVKKVKKKVLAKKNIKSKKPKELDKAKKAILLKTLTKPNKDKNKKKEKKKEKTDEPIIDQKQEKIAEQASSAQETKRIKKLSPDELGRFIRNDTNERVVERAEALNLGVKDTIKAAEAPIAESIKEHKHAMSPRDKANQMRKTFEQQKPTLIVARQAAAKEVQKGQPSMNR